MISDMVLIIGGSLVAFIAIVGVIMIILTSLWDMGVREAYYKPKRVLAFYGLLLILLVLGGVMLGLAYSIYIEI